MFTGILNLVVIYAFWHAVYATKTQLGGMNLTTMITYAVLALILGNYTSGVGDQLSRNIRDGSVSIELMRPYDLLFKLVALDIGTKTTRTIQGTIPVLVLAFAFMGIRPPASILSGVLFPISAGIAVLIGTQLDLMVGVLAFWLVNMWGMRVLRDAVLSFFTGSLIPISLFPAWLQTLSSFLPYKWMVFVPVSIYTGTISGHQVFFSIGIQLVWLAICFLFARLVWNFARKRVTIFGG